MCTGIKNMGFGPKEAGYQPPSIFIGSKEIRGICTKREKTTIKNDIDMRFTAIDTSAWEELKKSIEELALCMREHFGTKPEVPDLLDNGDVCRILNISKRTLKKGKLVRQNVYFLRIIFDFNSRVLPANTESTKSVSR